MEVARVTERAVVAEAETNAEAKERMEGEEEGVKTR